jgi:hypothetical protein
VGAWPIHRLSVKDRGPSRLLGRGVFEHERGGDMGYRIWLWLIAMLYVASLALPAIGDLHEPPTWRGFLCLIMVPWVCFFPPWWANVLLWLGCRLLARYESRSAAACGLIASVLAASFLCLAGPSGVGPGYWLWLGSMVALVAAGIWQGQGAVGVAEAMAWDD